MEPERERERERERRERERERESSLRCDNIGLRAEAHIPF